MQSLLGSLSVLDTEFTKDSALAHYGFELARSDFDEAFDGLVVKSLVRGQQSDGTYTLPKLIREYALEKHIQITSSVLSFSADTNSVVRGVSHEHSQFTSSPRTHTESRSFSEAIRAA
jgi:hypothetical protein